MKNTKERDMLLHIPIEICKVCARQMPHEYFCASVPTHEVRKLRQVDSVPVWSLVEDIPSKHHL